MDCMQSKFVSGTKLEGMAVTLEGRAAIQKELCVLDKRAIGNLINSNKGKWKVLCQGWSNFMQQDRLEAS